jgi:hypothetical protein
MTGALVSVLVSFATVQRRPREGVSNLLGDFPEHGPGHVHVPSAHPGRYPGLATSHELRGALAALGVKPPGTKPQRLATVVEHHSDPDRIASVVAKARAAALELIERRAGTAPGEPAQFIRFGPPGPGPGPGPGAVGRWALERGLLIQDRHHYGPARMPAGVPLALRGPGRHARFEPVPPPVRWASATRWKWTTRRQPRPRLSRPVPSRSCPPARRMRRPG